MKRVFVCMVVNFYDTRHVLIVVCGVIDTVFGFMLEIGLNSCNAMNRVCDLWFSIPYFIEH